MDPDISIVSKEKIDNGWGFSLEIKDEGKLTQHTVTLSKEHLEKFKYEKPEELVLASFLFLLNHEDNEAILPVFDLAEIVNYFSEYEEQVENYL